ncbi:hypothetical protein [Dongia mobilis]|jgi:hypothetical protein|uniref:hypothetical protein n=1 Tax=Dongia sp. TaxID=1977262 RepID=UPI0026F0B419
MSRKPNGSGRPDSKGQTGIGQHPTPPAAPLSMTTSPAFDMWLERQMKTLLSACDQVPDQKLVDLIRREFAKRDGKITD